MYSVPAPLQGPVPGICETQRVSSAYRARALVRSVADDPGKFAAVNMPSAGSFVVLKPRLTAGTLSQLSAQSTMRVKLAPKDRLWEPFSKLNVLSIVQLRVLRWDGARAPPEAAFVSPKPSESPYPPWFSNMAGVALSKKPSGDDCQPVTSSLTIEDDSVDRKLIEPVVRYDPWSP